MILVQWQWAVGYTADHNAISSAAPAALSCTTNMAAVPQMAASRKELKKELWFLLIALMRVPWINRHHCCCHVFQWVWHAAKTKGVWPELEENLQCMMQPPWQCVHSSRICLYYRSDPSCNHHQTAKMSITTTTRLQNASTIPIMNSQHHDSYSGRVASGPAYLWWALLPQQWSRQISKWFFNPCCPHPCWHALFFFL